MELTIENLIKIIVAVVVLAVVIVGIYFGFTKYIIPYFQDLGFSNELIGSLI